MIIKNTQLTEIISLIMVFRVFTSPLFIYFYSSFFSFFLRVIENKKYENHDQSLKSLKKLPFKTMTMNMFIRF